MERLRAVSLEPFDFEADNMSASLWFGEGFTSYYGGLVMVRAGFRSREAHYGALGGALTEVLHSPARRFRGPVEMSRYAPFVDEASWIDDTNAENTFISYYAYGRVLALGLDLELRTRFDVTLDDYMQALWARHGEPERPYTLDDLRTVLGAVSDPGFADAWFDGYVYDSGLPDYESLLAAAGLVLRPASPGTASLGVVRLRDHADGGVVLATSPSMGR